MYTESFHSDMLHIVLFFVFRNHHYFHFLPGGDDLGLDQYLDGYGFEDNNQEVGEDGNNQVHSTSERGATSAAQSTDNEDDDLNLDDLY